MRNAQLKPKSLRITHCALRINESHYALLLSLKTIADTANSFNRNAAVVHFH